MPEIEPKDLSLKSLKGVHLWHAGLSSCSQRVRIVLSETEQPYTSHIVAVEKNEHATAAYQAIHPKGVVPALVDDGRLFIESIDIIQHLAGPDSPLNTEASSDLLARADDSQQDLKLLTFEFLFRGGPPPNPEDVEKFQNGHQNEALKKFRLDFAKGFERSRIDAAVRAIRNGFDHLDQELSDGRPFLSGPEFSLSDIAWMPNVHRFELMGWPFEKTPHLADWFKRVSGRDSYRKGLLDWQPAPLKEGFASYTAKRRSEGTDVRTFGDLQ